MNHLPTNGLFRSPVHLLRTLFQLLAVCCICFSWLAPAAELQPPGFRPLPVGVHALVGGRVIVKPGTAIENGTIVIRDGRISAVGTNVAIPPDARVWDAKGLTIYPGFIDPYLSASGTNRPIAAASSEPIGAMSGVAFFGVSGGEHDPGQPGPGSTSARVTPERRVVQGLSPSSKSLEELRELGFTAANFVPERGIFRGTSAFLTIGDAEPGAAVVKPDVLQHIAFELPTGSDESYPVSLMGIVAVIRQGFFDAQFYQADMADYLKHPAARPRPVFDPSREALLPALEHHIPVVFESGSVLMLDRSARIAKEVGIDPILVASGQEWRRPDLMAKLDAPVIVPLNFPSLPKLPSADDWDSISLDQLRAWDWAAENPAVLRRAGREIALTLHGLGDRKKFREQLQLALDRGLSEDDALAALTTVPARLCGVADQCGTIEAGKLANLTLAEGSYFDPKNKIRSVWVDGRNYPVAPDNKPFQLAEKPAEPKKDADKDAKDKSKDKDDAKSKEARDLRRHVTARVPLADRGPILQPPAVLITNTTIWTCGPAGILSNASLLIRDGKVVQVGAITGALPAGTEVINGTGLHLTPGIIDCHSHTAILGDVNEGSIPSSAMVRIGDVVNSETENIHQQLAGGVTAVNLLHGSANPIGGQNCVIKMKFGASPEDLKIPDAPGGIKFALGENVKQSNWGEKYTKRFPQSRTGVRTFIQNRFLAAKQYLEAQAKFRRDGGVPPRRDLELEAIGEIIEGQRLIHCHSYRQDEILMLIRLMDDFGVRIGTLQHVLEGYKIADEIARHGAGGSTFSDWWAYKFEVYDAIPYNGSLMRDRGVLVSFNSDSSELARHLYLEAAKAVKYGDTPEIEALKFVTYNPAKQLGIEKHVGSLEPGKDGDFALWSHSPLDSATVCVQTWIEGKQYFTLAAAAARAKGLQKERDDLIAKAKKLESSGADGDKSTAAKTAFFQRAWEQSNRIIQCGECGKVHQ